MLFRASLVNSSSKSCPHRTLLTSLESTAQPRQPTLVGLEASQHVTLADASRLPASPKAAALQGLVVDELWILRRLRGQHN